MKKSEEVNKQLAEVELQIASYEIQRDRLAQVLKTGYIALGTLQNFLEGLLEEEAQDEQSR